MQESRSWELQFPFLSTNARSLIPGHEAWKPQPSQQGAFAAQALNNSQATLGALIRLRTSSEVSSHTLGHCNQHEARPEHKPGLFPVVLSCRTAIASWLMHILSFCALQLHVSDLPMQVGKISVLTCLTPASAQSGFWHYRALCHLQSSPAEALVKSQHSLMRSENCKICSIAL